MEQAQAADAVASLTIAICALITVICLLGFGWKWRSYLRKGPTGPLTAMAPGAAISLGIFGTFLGIYLGLRDFDTTDINSSIPTLLDGLKTAFVTSLFGMFFALVLRYMYGNLDRLEQQRSLATSDDPVELLREMASGLKSLDRSVNEIGASVVSCFKSDEEFSLLSQLKLIRTDMGDLKREVTKSLDEFGNRVAELGTEAMIKALRDVIEQFNTKLNDLVGEEFKQLKNAMLKLVEWQENHRTAVDRMQVQLQEHLEQVREATTLLVKAHDAINRTANSLSEIDSSVSALSVSAADIESHIANLKLHNEQLMALLVGVKKMGEEAKTVLPEFARHMNAATEKMSASAERSAKGFEDVSSAMKSSVEGVAGQMRTMADDHAKRVDDATRQLTKQLEETLTTSLNTLAGQLAALSAKFVEDYTPLTERLQNVVRIAQRLPDA